MPRKTATPFSQLQEYARKLLSGLAAEIRSKKSDLDHLEREFEQLTRIAGIRGAAPVSRRPVTKAIRGSRTGSRKRTNWADVLKQLPPEFKASEIRKVRGLKDKRASELFAGITRWIDSGAVKKKARGVYLKAK